jgi:hypothetical protein
MVDGSRVESIFRVSTRLPSLNWSFNMKSFLYRAGAALLGGLAMISMGCQEDNEAAIKEQEAKSTNVQVKNAEPPPKSQAEQGERARDQFKSGMKGSSYPGTSKGAKGGR